MKRIIFTQTQVQVKAIYRFPKQIHKLFQQKIYNTNGVLMIEMPAQTFTKGKHVLTLDPDKSPKGFYYLAIEKGNTRSLIKFIKI